MTWGVFKGNKIDSVSFDRINPSLGYIKSNTILCCNRINSIKNNLTIDELQEYMPLFYNKILKWREMGIICLQVAEGDF